ncbi:MAG TPA: hypothetical protein VNU95_09555 [Candidatus Acidoferrales bacterium]|jgi:hypothetical protein|nr:hypothetical protein [Candidatus Acidoferrales bacterium]
MSNEIILENVAPDEKLAQPSENDSSNHALTGKIARLPGDLREQINQRIFDGHSDPEILPWLNEFPVVKEMLAAKFKGQPITKQNMSNWRERGYQRWLDEKQNVISVENLGNYADRLTRAGAGRLAPAAAAVASGKLIQFLDTTDPTQTDPNNIVKCAAAASTLLRMEQNNERLKIAQERLRQHYLGLRLKRDKQQRTDAAVSLRVLADARAKAIEAAPWSHAEKIEGVGIHLFGPLWEPRPVPAPENPSQAKSSQVKVSPA